MFGFGCILIHRDILEQVPFELDTRSLTHADTLFYFQLHERGIKVAVDNTICQHLNSKWSGVKNIFKPQTN